MDIGVEGLAFWRGLGGADEEVRDSAVDGVTVEWVLQGFGGDLRVADVQPAFEGVVGRCIVAFVGVGDCESHEGVGVVRIELEGGFERSDSWGFLLVLGLYGP